MTSGRRHLTGGPNPRTFVSALIALSVLAVAIGAEGNGDGVIITSTTAANANLLVAWSPDDPEQIDAIYWNPAGLTGGEPNLTNPFVTGGCNAGDVEYFGNSWTSRDPQTGGQVLVGAGTTGARAAGPDHKVEVDSISDSASCPPSSAGVAVSTTYKFWQGGRPINRFKVTRSFSFADAFAFDFRPYVPRLYPISAFSQVLHPNAAGTNMITEAVGGSFCPFGCVVTDWDGNGAATAWFAIHDPSSGQGVIVRRTPSTFPVALWVDWDGASFTNASSVLALQPTGAFTGDVKEEQFLCFYDESVWVPSLELPPGC